MDDTLSAVREKVAKLRELEAETTKLRRELEAIRLAVGGNGIPSKREPSSRRGKHTRPVDPTSCAGLALASLVEAGAPMHIDMLLDLIILKGHAIKKATLVGQLARYVRKGEIFTRPEPNTFGLYDYTPSPKVDLEWEGETKTN